MELFPKMLFNSSAGYHFMVIVFINHIHSNAGPSWNEWSHRFAKDLRKFVTYSKYEPKRAVRLTRWRYVSYSTSPNWSIGISKLTTITYLKLNTSWRDVEVISNVCAHVSIYNRSSSEVSSDITPISSPCLSSFSRFSNQRAVSFVCNRKKNSKLISG